ncbi:MAG: hypothetical protein AAF587_43625 [Bacteroidota bacterium]
MKDLILKILPWAIGAAVLLFALIYYNPLGLWSSSKISLADTPTVIKELKELGEFVTAEYNGEVIESLASSNASENLIRQQLDSMPNIYQRIRVEYEKIYLQHPNRRRKRKKQWEAHEFAETYAGEIQIAKKALHMDEIDLLDYVIEDSLSWNEFKTLHGEALRAKVNRDLTKGRSDKIKVAYIGRGRVKAGFDLGSIEESVYEITLSRNAAGDSMRIVNLDPELMDADINPWYIYQPEEELEVPGYELFALKKAGKVEFSDVAAVKLACKQSLVSSALNQRKILDYAISSGQQTFKDLFNMFRKEGEPELVHVEIVPTQFYKFKADILADGRIETEEISRIRSKLVEKNLKADSQEAKALLVSLNKYHDMVLDVEGWATLLGQSGVEE